MPKECSSVLDTLYAAADLISADYKSDIYQYSGPITGTGFAHVVNAVLQLQQRPNCLLILTSTGGDLNIAYQIARFLHSKYSRLFICTPSFCRSAGTLIALGAHKILADEYAEFGPLGGDTFALDKSIDSGIGALATFEFGVDRSLDLFEKTLWRIRRVSTDDIRLDMAAELARMAAHSIMHPFLSNIQLSDVGKEFSNLAVALAYGHRLAEHTHNMREGAVEKLANGYPSHDFIIDYAEAQSLFLSIEKPATALYDLLGCLEGLVYAHQEVAVVRCLQRPRFQSDDGDAPPKGLPLSSCATNQVLGDALNNAIKERFSGRSAQPLRKLSRKTIKRKS